MLRRVPLRLAIFALAWSLGVSAQTPAEIDAARKLFSQAYQDETSQNYSAALGKFEKVLLVKDTPAVRFRIGSCQEKLGKLLEARSSFERARALAGSDPDQRKLASEAEEQLVALDKRIPTVTMTSPKPGTRVEIDGIETTTFERPIAQNPGKHEVHFVRAETQSSIELELAEGTKQTLEVPRLGETSSNTVVSNPSPPDGGDFVPRFPWQPVAFIAGGGVMAMTAGIFFGLRQSKIGEIEDRCPGFRCPTSQKNEIESMRSTANTYMGVTLVAGALGIAGITLGIVGLSERKPGASGPRAWFVPSLAGGGVYGEF